MIITFGDLVMDILVTSNGPLQYGSDSLGSIKLQGGGSAANFAAWAAFLGAKIKFAARIGDDLIGKYLEKELQEYGVITNFVVDQKYPSGKILLFLDDQGERTMVTDRGACQYLRFYDLDNSDFKSANHLHLTGYSLFNSTDNLELVRQSLILARKNQMSVSIDPSSYALLQEYGVDNFLDITRGINLIFPNLEESQVLSGESGIDKIAEKLLEYYQSVVIKLGKDGCYIKSKTQQNQQGRGIKISRNKKLESANAAIIDTTGAGDSFAAAFLQSYLSGDTLIEAGKKAVNTAYQCIHLSGGRPQSESKVGL